MKVMDKKETKRIGCIPPGTKIEKLIMEDIEKETRVEEKPVPPSQLDRIERMLKWLVQVQKINLYDSGSSFLQPHDRITAIHNLPDISDIIKP